MRSILIFSQRAEGLGPLLTALREQSKLVCRPILSEEAVLIEQFYRDPPDVALFDLTESPARTTRLIRRVYALPLYRRPLLFALCFDKALLTQAVLSDELIHCFCAPSDWIKTARTLADLSESVRYKDLAPHCTEALLERMITELLLSLHIYPHLSGFHSLRLAIRMVYEAGREERLSMMCEVYPAAAKRCHMTVATVEHSMRHAIDTAWNRSNLNALQRYFGYTISDLRDTPSNSAFIYMLAERLRMQLGYPPDEAFGDFVYQIQHPLAETEPFAWGNAKESGAG